MQITAVSVADAVADELRRRLLAGEYTAGEHVRDTELAAEFDVARPTIRAAVQMLVADGLLERGRGRSAQVRLFTAADAVDLYRLRRPIEIRALELVVSSGARLDEVEAALQRFAALNEEATWQAVADHDVAFHRTIFVAAQSPRLLRTFDEVASELRLLIAQLRPTYSSISDLVTEHAGLLQALRDADIVAATRAWNAHFDQSEEFFLHLMKERA